MKRLLLLFLCTLLVKGAPAQQAGGSILEGTRTQLRSPDGRLEVELYQKQADDGKKRLYYKVSFKDRPIILESALDIQMDNHIMESALALKPDTARDWCASLVFQKSDSSSRDTTWRPQYGEKTFIRDRYNEATLHFVKADRPKYTMQLICRAYDGGVALRYYFPENPTGVYYHITAENTEFTLPPDTRAWFTSWAQGPYQLLPLRAWPDESERPLPLQLPGGLYACLAEAQMVDYARTKFKLSPDKPNTIVTSLFGAVDGITYFGTPWRAILIGEQAADLIRSEDILLNLNPPSAIQDEGWIKPGKIIREMTLTTEGARASIDFAAAHHLQYILFDWKWYGPAMTFNTDATKVVAPIDMQDVVHYGREKGIGVWLYVNQQSLLKQLDTILPLYEQWGIKGVKFGFVELGSQRWTTWLEEAIQKAAAHHLMVDVHDEFRPTGEQRTWPNLLSAEGIRGNEEMPDATHNTILPFTRFIAGPADYTICYYDHRIKTTHAHQLALAAIYYSPLLTLFWYDKPSAYHNEPEIEFFEKIPISWDETKVLDGQPGAFITMARRRGDDWFLGTITNDSARTMKISFDFLPRGKKYTATIYSDDPAVPTATHVRREQRTVDASTVLSAELSPSGGQAVWLTPVRAAAGPLLKK
jgi:alpha-glucosidase